LDLDSIRRETAWRKVETRQERGIYINAASPDEFASGLSCYLDAPDGEYGEAA